MRGEVFQDQQTERGIRQSGAAEADLSSQFVSVRTAASEVSGSFTADTRANRLAAVGMLEGDRWLEGDGWEYYFDGLIWRYLSGVWVGTDAARGAITPITGEDRALFFATDTGVLWEVVTTTWTKRLEIAGTANQITVGIVAGIFTLSLNALVPQRLASVSINLNTTSVQDVYTVPASKTLIPTMLIIRTPSTDVSGVALAIQLRESSGSTNFWSFDNSPLTGTSTFISIVPGENNSFANGILVTAGNKVQAVLVNPFGSAATATAEVYGILI